MIRFNDHKDAPVPFLDHAIEATLTRDGIDGVRRVLQTLADKIENKLVAADVDNAGPAYMAVLHSSVNVGLLTER